MSYDILVLNLPPEIKTVADMKAAPPPVGTRADLISRIRAIFPNVDFSDSSWGRLDGGGFSIEFNMGGGDLCDSIMLHVRGGGDAMEVVGQLLHSLSLRAFDLQTGEFFASVAGEKGFADWKSYRDRVVRRHAEQEPEAEGLVE